jgi:hypothetical protein
VPTASQEHAASARARGYADRTSVRWTPGVQNAPVNTIALSRETTYHGYMTTWKPTKRDGHMNPISQLEAALIGGVVAV